MQHEIDGEIVKERLSRALYKALLDGGADKQVVDGLRKDKKNWEILLLGVKLAGAQFQVMGRTRDQGLLTTLADQVGDSMVNLFGANFGEFLGEVVWNTGATVLIELMDDLESADETAAQAMERMTKS